MEKDGNGIMNEIKNYLTQQEEIEKQQKELAELERIYNDRIKLGVEHIKDEDTQGLAQTILDKKKQIEYLKSQIDIIEPSEQNNEENKQETSLIKYHKNPLFNWLQKMVIKIQNKIEKIDEKEAMRRNRKMAGPKFHQTKTEEYQEAIDLDSSKNGLSEKIQQKTWDLSPKQQSQCRKEQVQIAKKYEEKGEKSTKLNRNVPMEK